MYRWPTVPTSRDLVDHAFRKGARATAKRGRTAEERVRNLAAVQVRTAGNAIESRLRGVVRGVPNLDAIHPFIRDLVEALVGVDPLRSRLGALEWAADRVHQVVATYLPRIGSATPPEARRLRREAFGRMASFVEQVADDLEMLRTYIARLRALPDIDTSVPTIVVAGAPNVGKSAFVRAVSSGRPKVAAYPFTTQRLELGHFDRAYQRYQVVDTPGLLDRPLERHNAIERQAVAALRHVAHVVVFLLDPSETCGMPLPDQEGILASVQAAFPDTPFLVVENKADLHRSSSAHLKVSALTGKGVRRAIDAALRILTSRVPEAAPPGESR